MVRHSNPHYQLAVPTPGPIQRVGSHEFDWAVGWHVEVEMRGCMAYPPLFGKPLRSKKRARPGDLTIPA